MQAMRNVLSKSSETVQMCSEADPITISALKVCNSLEHRLSRWKVEHGWNPLGWIEGKERPGGLPPGTGMCGTPQGLGEQGKRSWMAGCFAHRSAQLKDAASKSTGSRLSFPKSWYFLIDEISKIKLEDWQRVDNVLHK